MIKCCRALLICGINDSVLVDDAARQEAHVDDTGSSLSSSDAFSCLCVWTVNDKFDELHVNDVLRSYPIRYDEVNDEFDELILTLT